MTLPAAAEQTDQATAGLLCARGGCGRSGGGGTLRSLTGLACTPLRLCGGPALRLSRGRLRGGRSARLLLAPRALARLLLRGGGGSSGGARALGSGGRRALGLGVRTLRLRALSLRLRRALSLSAHALQLLLACALLLTLLALARRPRFNLGLLGRSGRRALAFRRELHLSLHVFSLPAPHRVSGGRGRLCRRRRSLSAPGRARGADLAARRSRRLCGHHGLVRDRRELVGVHVRDLPAAQCGLLAAACGGYPTGEAGAL